MSTMKQYEFTMNVIVRARSIWQASEIAEEIATALNDAHDGDTFPVVGADDEKMGLFGVSVMDHVDGPFSIETGEEVRE